MSNSNSYDYVTIKLMTLIFRRPSIKVFNGTPKKNFLIIPDVHLCYEHPKALEFLLEVKNLYQIPDEHVISLGDLTDMFFYSRFPRGADNPITPNQEIEMVRDKIKLWAKAFPKLKICHANHEARLMKKAIEAELPSQVLKTVRELFKYPKEWEVEECFVPNVKHKFLCLHGDGHGLSSTTLVNNPRQFGMSVVFGHFHSLASIVHVNTQTLDMWGFNAGCLIDETSFVFEYGQKSKYKASIGCGVILAEGRVPIFHPLLT